MSNPYLTGSFNKYRNKIKGNTKMNLSITPNTKITQYLDKRKNTKNHKSPSNFLNKSQNCYENQKISKINLKSYIMNKNLNRRQIYNNTKIKPHNKKSNSINPSRNNFSIKLNSMNNLPGYFIINNTNFINNNTNNNININHNNKTMSKNNSLSYYYSSNYNTTNNKTKNAGKINNDYTLQKLMCLKANLSYYNNLNYNKAMYKKSKKNPSVNLTTDNSNSRNLKSSPCNYFITEESKMAVKDKNKVKNKSKLKMSYLNLKKSKKKTNNNTLLIKIKPNIPLKIPHKNSYHPPQVSFGGDISIEKNNPSPPIDTIEIKINNELKNLKDVDKSEKFSKLKKIYDESVENFVPKEFKNIFLLIYKEFEDINKTNNNEINSLKTKYGELSEKIKVVDDENNNLKKKL